MTGTPQPQDDRDVDRQDDRQDDRDADRDAARAREASEERFALKAFLALFALAGLIIAVVTIFGGGVGGD